MMYHDMYRIVTSVSRYVSYCEVNVSLQAYSIATLPAKTISAKILTIALVIAEFKYSTFDFVCLFGA